MNKNTIAIAFVLAAVIPLVYAQSLPLTGESETETEQDRTRNKTKECL
jgi:hypothetical protein